MCASPAAAAHVLSAMAATGKAEKLNSLEQVGGCGKGVEEARVSRDCRHVHVWCGLRSRRMQSQARLPAFYRGKGPTLRQHSPAPQIHRVPLTHGLLLSSQRLTWPRSPSQHLATSLQHTRTLPPRHKH